MWDQRFQYLFYTYLNLSSTCSYWICSLFDFYFRTLQSINHFDQNAPSTFRWSGTKDITNVSAENMTVTPDIALPNNDSTSTLILPKLPIYYLVPNVVHEEPTSSLVDPDTGYHFLYDYAQTVDLTQTEENNEK